jgi:hypothetical protein
MADIRHSGYWPVSDLNHDGLASIQLALRFIGVKMGEADRIEVEEKGAADDAAGFGGDKWIPEGRVNSLKTAERGVHPLEPLASEGCDALRVYESSVDKQMDRLLAWHASSSSDTLQGISACSGRWNTLR